jgi:23S rRNA A1618 N6-methylase RlmF
MTEKEKQNFIKASKQLKNMGLSNIITITDQKDKDRLLSDIFLKAELFGNNPAKKDKP